MKRILSIIVTFNFEPWLDKCIQSLIYSTYANDILVLDNNSKDNTVKILKEKYPCVTVIENKTNLGFGRANNIGLVRAVKENYDFAFLVNQDAWVDQYCLERLIKGFDSSLGVVSPMHFDGTGRNLDQGFETYIKNESKTNYGGIVPFINAAFWLLPISTIRTTGLFSQIFHHYGEDKDFSNRIIYHNLKIAYIESAIAYHDRQNRVQNDKSFHKAEFVYYLTEYCNINYSFPTAFLKAMGGIGKKIIKSLSSASGKHSSSYLKSAWRIFCLTPKVLNTRSSNKAIQKNVTL